MAALLGDYNGCQEHEDEKLRYTFKDLTFSNPIMQSTVICKHSFMWVAGPMLTIQCFPPQELELLKD